MIDPPSDEEPVADDELQAEPPAPRRDPAWVAEALRRIQEGSDVEDQFRRLYLAYEPEVRRLAGALVAPEAVDDLVQDAMLRVYKGVKTFRFRSTFHTWLTTLVKNLAKNAHRARGTAKAATTLRAQSLDALLAPGEDGRPAAGADPESPEPAPLDRTLGAERRERLESSLEALPERMRQSVMLHHFHGYKYREIAELQGVSVATVKKQIVEGRRRLRPALLAFAKLFGLFLVLLVAVGCAGLG